MISDLFHQKSIKENDFDSCLNDQNSLNMLSTDDYDVSEVPDCKKEDREGTSS